MKKNSHKYLIIKFLSIIYLLHLVLKFADITVPIWVSSYLADILCLPLLLFLITLIIRKIQQNPFFKLDFGMILFAFLALSLVFEMYLPLISPRYTSDKIDILMYAFGGILFYLFQSKLVD
jgi:hypothetical protein